MNNELSKEKFVKTIVGIDNQGAYVPAVKLLAGLGLSLPEVKLLHAVNPEVPYVPLGLDPGLELQGEYAKVVQNLGVAALEEARGLCARHDLPCKTQMVFGGAADSLMELVDREDTDLVAVATHPRSMWSPSFVGSVSRSLVISCHASVLVAKGVVPEGRKLRAVLATDHSDYSTRWVDHFLQMKPSGIGSIHVVTAYDVDDHEAEILHRNLPSLGGMVDFWIEDRLADRNCALVERLTDAGYAAKCRVIKADANDAIRRTMQDTHADLLIVGAQGHGFLERVLIGSVSLHQAIYEPYSVLIVRA
jgi:nucleotide-binding universal stress UspA family protein